VDKNPLPAEGRILCLAVDTVAHGRFSWYRADHGSRSGGPKSRASCARQQYVISLLQDTLRDYLALAGKATKRSGKFNPAPDRWSLAEVTEQSDAERNPALLRSLHVIQCPATSRTAFLRLRGTTARQSILSRRGKTRVIENWSCRWDRGRAEESLLRAFEERRQMSIDLARQ